MSIEYRLLRPEAFPEVHRTFVTAFADYFVDMSYLSAERLLSRARKNGISFESSVGAYAGNEMVGFMLVGLDDREAPTGAFDIATGVLPSHRGRGVAPALMARACAHLKSLGVQHLLLEVIQENEAAIRAYQAAGFDIRRELYCYELARHQELSRPGTRPPYDASATSSGGIEDEPYGLGHDGESLVAVREVPASTLQGFEADLDWAPSWENSIDSILRVTDEVMIFGATALDTTSAQPVGALVYYPALDWILTLVVRRTHRRRGIGSVLLQHLEDHTHPEARSLRLLNVDRRDGGTRSFLERTGFRVYVKQYEMELFL